jgi:hypothetical protein
VTLTILWFVIPSGEYPYSLIKVKGSSCFIEWDYLYLLDPDKGNWRSDDGWGSFFEDRWVE